MIFQAVRYEVSVPTASGSLGADLVLPPGPGPHPAAVLVGGPCGPRDRGQWVEALALSGLATLTWDTSAVHRSWDRSWDRSWGPPSWLAPDERALQVAAAVDALRTVPQVAPDRVVVVGSDTGAWAAALAASLCSGVAALVMVAPPCTGAWTQELGRLAQRLRGLGFIEAEVGLAQLVLRERIRRLAAGEPPGGVLAAEAPCRHAPWYGLLPGTTAPELAAFATLGDYDPAMLLAPVRCPVLSVFGEDDPVTQPWPNVAHLRQRVAPPPPGRERAVAVLPRTDDAFATVTAPGWPRPPGDWHPDVVHAVTAWLAPRLGGRPAWTAA